MCPLWPDGITEPTSPLVGFFHGGGGSCAKPCHGQPPFDLQLLFHCAAQQGKVVYCNDMFFGVLVAKHTNADVLMCPGHKNLTPAALFSS